MRIAILVAESDYSASKLNDLPGCKNDVALMHSVFVATGQFDDILILDQSPSGSHMKSQISIFVKSHQKTSVDEVFFYYTGHGGVYDDDFYFTGSDFDNSLPRSTALANSELDNLLRSLEAELTVKMVDACHSGIHYVKDGDDSIEANIRKSQKGFKKCFFLFGSSAYGFSYQDSKISHFTASFGKSIANYSEAAIRYFDIASYIADEFERNDKQKPVFVSQVNGTEVFAEVTDDVRQAAKKYLSLESDAPVIVNEPSKDERTLLAQIKKDAMRYCSREEAMSAFVNIKNKFQEYEFVPSLLELYKLELSFPDNIPSFRLREDQHPGNWLKKNEEDLFVEFEYDYESYVVEVEDYSRWTVNFALAAIGEKAPTKKETRDRRLLTGFTFTEEPPFTSVQLIARPLFPNLPWYELSCFFVFSKVDAAFFHSVSRRKLLDWQGERFRRDKIVDWTIVETQLKNELEGRDVALFVFGAFESLIVDELESLYVSKVYPEVVQEAAVDKEDAPVV